jgi:DNA-binding NtrC family response regulator
MDDAIELVIVPQRNALPIRAQVARIVTTIGSADSADIRLPGLRPQWAVLRKRHGVLALSLMDTGAVYALEPGRSLQVDGVTLSWSLPEAAGEGLPVARLAEVLTDAVEPADALRALLAEMMAAAGAETGAVLLREEGDFTVAVAQNAAGQPLEGAATLLSDTIVREVLDSARAVHVADAAVDTRYGQVPSVVSLALKAVLCAPMTLKDRVVGAIFLGKKDARVPFGARFAQELGVVASLAVPLLTQMRRAAGREAPAASLVGDHAAVAELRKLIERVAPSDLTVLVSGETGTGKEVVARAIHARSLRGQRPLVAINCSAVPESLLAAELFGAKKGAFTGAVADRKGRIEHADGSTLFLDEVADMPLAMQAALLRVLEDREVVRVGEAEPRRVDFRLVAATHKDLEEEVRAGRFREDLLHRLNEFRLVLPPLRARGEDILLLARLFLRQTELQLGLRPHHIDGEVAAALLAHPWPGNVRELRAAMRRAAVLAEAEALSPEDLQLASPARRGDRLEPLDRTLAEARDAFVSRYIAAVLERCAGDRDEAARRLGVSVRSLYRHLAE